MTPDRISALLRDAVSALEVPPYPAQTIAMRIAQAPRIAVAPRRPVRTIVIGGLICAAALAATVPKTYVIPDPVLRTMERLTGTKYAPVRTYEVPKRSLEEVRAHTTFPIVVPHGVRVLEADSFGPNKGVMLIVTIDGRNQVELVEQWAKTRRPSGLDGVGIQNDGSIRRFDVRRWQIDGIDYSVTMFDPTYRKFAAKIEQAIRETVAEKKRAGAVPRR
jgi:hypothetical protein